jgi:cardiolipin synthase
MNIATTRGTTSRAMSLPNILTYGRIAAIPVVVGCIYAQSILDQLVASCLLMLAADGIIHGWSLWAAIVILCREILVSGLREYLAALRVSVPVTKLAKWKTTVQLIAIGFLLAGPAGDEVVPVVSMIGLALLWASAILTIYTGYDYFRAGIHHLIKEDEA